MSEHTVESDAGRLAALLGEHFGVTWEDRFGRDRGVACRCGERFRSQRAYTTHVATAMEARTRVYIEGLMSERMAQAWAEGWRAYLDRKKLVDDNPYRTGVTPPGADR